MLKKMACLITAACLFALLLPGCAPAQRPADNMNDRTNYPNDMYAPDNGTPNGTVPDGNDSGLERTGNRWNDWMGRDRVQPMDKDNDGFMDNVGPDNDGVLGDTINRRPPGNNRTR